LGQHGALGLHVRACGGDFLVASDRLLRHPKLRRDLRHAGHVALV
jgi:hypothetical protein